MVKTMACAVTADDVLWACAKAIGNLVHALSLCPPECVDHADPTQVCVCAPASAFAHLQTPQKSAQESLPRLKQRGCRMTGAAAEGGTAELSMRSGS